MKLIISTHRNCFTYDVDTKKRKDIKRGTEGRNWAYGISWCDDRLFIAWREPHEILEYDTSLKFTGRRCETMPKKKLGDMHQITCHDGKIWAANTGHNAISIFDAKSLKLLDLWRPHEEIDDRDDPDYIPKEGAKPSRYKHYNSVMFHGKKMYVNAHMTVHNPPSKVWEFTYPERKFIRKIPGGNSSHNVFFIKGQLAVCDSINGTVIAPEKSKVLFNCNRASFLRGVCMPGDKVIIGRSDVCKDRKKRDSVHGGIIIFQNENLRKRDTHWLGAGPVEEIRCLDMMDKAHPVDKKFW